MRIVIIGAGAIGSYLGYKLDSGGHEVVLCDQGTRLEEVKNNGVRMEDVLTGQSLSAKTDVEPEPVGEFDVVVLAVRAHQMSGALPMVEKAAGPADQGVPVVLIGGYVDGMADWAEQLGEERVLFAFPGMSAVLEKQGKNRVVSFCERGEDDAEPWGITIGRLQEPIPDQQTKACRALNDSGIPVHHAESMEAVFLSQALVRLPMLAALKSAGGTLERLSVRGDLLKLLIKATREGLAAVKKTGLKPVPDSLEMYRWVPIFISANMIKHRFDTAPSKIGIEAFAVRAGDELRFLAGQFLEMAVASGSEFEHLEYLFSELD